jgi:hypothetical protein
LVEREKDPPMSLQDLLGVGGEGKGPTNKSVRLVGGWWRSKNELNANGITERGFKSGRKPNR